jgi:hypothetical protein
MAALKQTGASASLNRDKMLQCQKQDRNLSTMGGDRYPFYVSRETSGTNH